MIERGGWCCCCCKCGFQVLRVYGGSDAKAAEQLLACIINDTLILIIFIIYAFLKMLIHFRCSGGLLHVFSCFECLR